MKKRILVAPLNWGIGHAARCIPIINELIANNYEPIIASDGDALEFLKKEFPQHVFISLAGYNIKYARNRRFFKWVLFMQSKKVYSAILAENKQTNQIVDAYAISGIISDNRLGVRNDKVPSVIITHQLNVLSGNTSKTTSKIHQQFIKKFDAVWVPDFEKEPHLSGQLGHLISKNTPLKIIYIGPLSRMEKKKAEKKYDIMVVLSGPEPQRSLLEEKLFNAFKKYEGELLVVQGKMETEQIIKKQDQFTIYNFMTTKDIETAMNGSQLIIARSGYTTIMDMAALEKQAFFIPTPGQSEQEYLAELLSLKGIAPYCAQKNFCIESLKSIANYNGFKKTQGNFNFKALFAFFESK